jgi:hypothetical protein
MQLVRLNHTSSRNLSWRPGHDPKYVLATRPHPEISWHPGGVPTRIASLLGRVGLGRNWPIPNPTRPEPSRGEAYEVHRGRVAKADGIQARTARRWLKAMGFDYRSPKKGVYLDGHERADVVAYREEEFLPEMARLQPAFAQWIDGHIVHGPSPAADGRWIVVVVHDESTFHVNDGRRHVWLQKGHNPLRPKGTGKGIMVSDFLTPQGRLRVPDHVSDDEVAGRKLRRLAAQFLEYGPNNYWDGAKMAAQTLDFAVPISSWHSPQAGTGGCSSSTTRPTTGSLHRIPFVPPR